MSILGKILAFLNILGAAGFIALASMTYAKRHAWEYANFQFDLRDGGLPLDDTDGDRENRPLVRKFGQDPAKDRTIKEFFPSDPVWTQVQEVKKVREKLDTFLAEDDIRKKNIKLARLLLPLSGSNLRPEIYGDREFYLSMKAHLDNDEKYAAFKQALTDAIPVAVSAMEFDREKISFEKAFQQALADLPGEDKRKLAEAFLKQLLIKGVKTKNVDGKDKTVGEIVKDKILDVEKKLKEKTDAEKELDVAKSASFIADAEAAADPTPVKRLKATELKMAMNDAQAKVVAAKEAVKNEPDPRLTAALVFLQTIRIDEKKTKIAEFVDEVMEETLKDVNAELTKRYEDAYQDAFAGKEPFKDAGADLQLVRDRRRLAIARFLLAAIEALSADEKVTAALQSGDVELLEYKRFINVVGLEAATLAINEQYQLLTGVMSDLTTRIADERNSFRIRHHEAILALKRRADDVEALAKRVADIADYAARQEKIAKDEADRVVIYKKDLEVSRGQTGDEMKRLSSLTGGLNQVRIAIRDAIDNNAINLRRIQALELEVQSLEGEWKAQEKADKKKRGRTAP